MQMVGAGGRAGNGRSIDIEAEAANASQIKVQVEQLKKERAGAPAGGFDTKSTESTKATNNNYQVVD